MAQSWDAEFAVTDDLAARLIASQFPALLPLHLEFLGAGFDNSAYLVNGEWVFRFPRRTMGVDLLKIEMRVLPDLPADLPLAIPAPTLVGSPVDDFPHPFAGYRKIEGETADRLDLSEEDIAASAPLLGQFLKALHQAPADGAPADLIRRSDFTYRIPWLRQRMANSSHLHRSDDVSALYAFLDRIEPLALAPERQCLVHGDLYARHLVFDGDRLVGVIDWGDLHLGDPALDLSIAYSFFPPEARPAFFSAYGPVTEEALLRAQCKAALYAVLLVEYGEDIHDPAIRQAGRRAMELLAEEWR